jgi:hypothetical protein
MSPYEGSTGQALITATPTAATADEHNDALAYLRRRNALDLAPFLGLNPDTGLTDPAQ